jgi:hypothetical protein
MPLKQMNPARSADHDALVGQLAQEWLHPDPKATEPVIIEESRTRGASTYVYVVWSAWPSLSRDMRGEIIMDAAEKVKSQQELLKITVAMGLTPDEADRFGIKWR